MRVFVRLGGIIMLWESLLVLDWEVSYFFFW